jgi:hypothetical protein
MQTFRIKIGNKTRNHKDVLEKLGFKVRIEDGHYVFEANALTLQGEVDIRTPEAIKAFARHCRDKQEVATYQTKFRATKGDGTEAEVSSILACTFLGADFSALVAKPGKAGGAKKVGLNIADLDL